MVGVLTMVRGGSEYTKNIGDFINHSEFFEVTSTSMYQGTLKMISNKDYSALAGSILGVQARHSGWIQYATKKKNPWNTAFEAPLVVNDIWTTGDPFFSTCPPGGPGLPSLPTGITQYPLFSVDPSDTIVPGNKVTIDLSEAFTSNPSSIPNDSSDKKLFTVFSVSWGTHMRPMSKGDNSDDSHKYSVEVPHELSSIGAVYVYVVQATDDEASHPHFEVNESNAVAGPRVWMFGFDSEGKPDNGYELFSGSRTVALVN
ncbi:hypothetical protein CC2G_003561 [Coprinopsis cinerea AmutBmut pab1-1]|nr:hypothetical protein CC2G_003561 [Coprinopsis cinerea AmutBmut pab1-1]